MIKDNLRNNNIKELKTMSRINLFIVISIVFILIVSCNNNFKYSQEMIVGGDDVLMILDFHNSTDSIKKINWSLKTSEITNLPDSMIKYLKTIDDHKSVDDNTKILFCSSSGGTVMVDRKTKECLFYAITPNAHSVEYLPDNRIAIALSTAVGGNSLEIFDLAKSNNVLFKDSLFSAHGVSWIEKRNMLYALGFDELRAYSLKNWETQKPSLIMEEKWMLPETGGHDLFASSDNQLLLSTSKSVWIFNLNTNVFEPFHPIGNESNVKSVYLDEQSGHIIYTKGEIDWWTHNIYSINPNKRIIIPELNVYKIRMIK